MTRWTAALGVGALAATVALAPEAAVAQKVGAGAQPAHGTHARMAHAQGRITVTGHGHVTAAPDMATITLGVTTEAPDAAAAMKDNSARQAKVLAALTAAGVAAKDVQTSGLSLAPRWQQPTKSGEKASIAGFVATNTVTVRVRALDKLGEVLDQLTDAGANTLHGLSFGIAAPEALEDRSRQMAVADAARKAALYAKAAGVSLGAIRSIDDEGGPHQPRPMMRMAAASAAEAVPVAAGEVSIDATVRMVFAIRQ